MSLSLVSASAIAQNIAALGHHEALPDAPSFVLAAAQAQSSETRSGTARISGTVLDINGGLVAGATVTLVEAGLPAGVSPGAGLVVTSDTAGRFVFDKLPAGRFKFTITAQGLQTFVSGDILLKPGESREAPQVDLPIASTNIDVQVTVTQVELAQEQIRAEEKQRAFGVLPNFYTSYIWNAAPLTKGQKMHLAFKSATDPVEFLGAAVQGAAQYNAGQYAGYGYGFSGYSKRFAAAYGDGAFARVIGSGILPSVLHQDPRYFYKGSGTKKSRALYAISRAFITRGDDGKHEPNYSHIGGAFLGGAISNAYHPHADRGVGLTITNGLIDTAGNAVNNLIREFILREITPNVPDYANGQPDPSAKPASPTKPQ
ncbi:carboxypeptidase-like regulatory domain-containing protein [Granulicella aggregans]|uniref:carboxypeptidase-like regulatory domain-containing protein n=1 Tax=Granulicella aggregans TaxID=474949 RepID=UPI001C85D8BD|nr:carboxypeptidase-like regulatory domain-containing protein [Granulicella aggregans]